MRHLDQARLGKLEPGEEPEDLVPVAQRRPGDWEKPWEVRQGIENLSRRVDGLSLEDLAGNDLMRTFVTWTTVP